MERSETSPFGVTTWSTANARTDAMRWSIVRAIGRLISNSLLEFLVRPHRVIIGGRLIEPLAVVKVLKKLDLRCVQAATAFTGGAVERTGPDFRQVSGNRRKASKFRKRAASASLTRVSVAASHRGGSGRAARLGRSAGPARCGRSERGGASAAGRCAATGPPGHRSS